MPLPNFLIIGAPKCGTISASLTDGKRAYAGSE